MDNHHRPHGVPDQHEQRVAADLDDFITALDGDTQPALPAALTDDERAAFDMATRFQRQLPLVGAAPSAGFVARLGARLAAHFAATPAADDGHDAAPTPVMSITGKHSQDASATSAKPAKRRSSRRVLLTGGLATAAGLAAGVAGGILVEHAAQPPATAQTGPWGVALVGGNGVWLAVARVADLAPGAVKRFATANLVGHLIRRNDGSFYALSAACTHMGCIVAWNGPQRTFDCPCHNGRFDGQGTALPNQPIAYRPLPTIATKIAADTVYVWVPAAAPTEATTPSDMPSSGGTYGGE